MSDKSRILISGMGAVSPNGIGVKEYWDNTQRGISGIKTIDFFDTSQNRVKIGGFIHDIDKICFKHKYSELFYDRASILTKIAADEALEDAGITPETIPSLKIGIILGIALGGMQSFEKCYHDFFIKKTGIVSDAFISAMPNMSSALLAMEYGIRGANYTINTACSSSAAAMGLAILLIQAGMIDVCITGGSEAPLTPSILKNFESLKILNSRSNEQPEKASKPYSMNRSGFVLSEGAGIVILESERHLDRRNGKKHAEILGYGTSNDAFHVVAPDLNGQLIAISSALDNGCLKPEQVDYIHAHGTATKKNDIIETQAIKKIYDQRAYDIPISSIKSMIGHTIGASAALSVICTAQALKYGFLPPTVNLDVPDPECDLDYLPNVGRESEAKIAMVHSFGFGGNNNVIALAKSA
jgi:3-oxoacyl-[acyl-carrier-protein] synthase II